MSYSDETLMAFADGELDEATRRAVEQAIRQDPALAAKVRQHQALRTNVFNAFASTLDEAVPQRLQAAARTAKIVHLDSVRKVAPPPPPVEKPRWVWPEWGSLAASLVVGVLAGVLGMTGVQRLNSDAPLVTVAGHGGVLTAQGKLDIALTEHLASVPRSDSPVRIGASFLSREGSYCRSFSLPGSGGLACRQNGQWIIPVMGNTDASASEYRQAGSTMPTAVLDAIDQRIVGSALDAGAERSAQKQGWKR